MKALSLYEPWATLIGLKLKRYETRSWQTSYRGPLLICASIKRPPFPKVIRILYRARLTLNDLNPGKAIALVDLTYIYKIRANEGDIGEDEAFYGDFSPDRYAWQLDNVRLVDPVPIRGKQGMFEVDDRLITFRKENL